MSILNRYLKVIVLVTFMITFIEYENYFKPCKDAPYINSAFILSVLAIHYERCNADTVTISDAGQIFMKSSFIVLLYAAENILLLFPLIPMIATVSSHFNTSFYFGLLIFPDSEHPLSN